MSRPTLLDMDPLMLLKVRLGGLQMSATQQGDKGMADEVATLLIELETFYHFACGAVTLLAEAEVIDELHSIEWQAKRAAVLKKFTEDYAEVLGSHKLEYTINKEVH